MGLSYHRKATYSSKIPGFSNLNRFAKLDNLADIQAAR